MLKRFLVVAAAGIGLVYASGSDLASVKQAVTGAAAEGARSFTGQADEDWGAGTRY